MAYNLLLLLMMILNFFGEAEGLLYHYEKCFESGIVRNVLVFKMN